MTTKVPQYAAWLRSAIAETMKGGGYYDTVMAAGPELDRLKAFLQALETSDHNPGRELELAEPNPWILPMFPGLRNVPYPDPADFDWVPKLEAEFETLRAEGQRLREALRPSSYKSVHQGGRWMQGNIGAFGSRLPAAYWQGEEPLEAIRAAQSLPRFCGFSGYPFGQFLYSAMEPGLHIPLHTSADNFRARCHLPLVVPENCRIQVAGETRHWQEGKALFLDDAFFHEVWNDSDSERLVLIIDFWHPDFTDAEIRALCAGLRKAEVRRLLIPARNVPLERVDAMFAILRQQDAGDAELAEFWPKPAPLLENRAYLDVP